VAEETVAVPITDVLQLIDRGRAADDASSLLRDVVRAVTTTGKQGHVTIKVVVAPLKKGQPGHELSVWAEVDGKPPKPDAESSVFFADLGFNLSRNDPHQMTIDDIARSAS